MNPLSRCHLFNSLRFSQQNIDNQIIYKVGYEILEETKGNAVNGADPFSSLQFSHTACISTHSQLFTHPRKRKEDKELAYFALLWVGGTIQEPPRAGIYTQAASQWLSNTQFTTLVHLLFMNCTSCLSTNGYDSHFCNDKNQPHLRGRIDSLQNFKNLNFM